jgi:hypothetical protein
MIKGTWIVKSTKIVCGFPSASTYAKPNSKADANLAAVEALENGHFDIEVYFYEHDEYEAAPAYGSFSEALEYDFSQN